MTKRLISVALLLDNPSLSEWQRQSLEALRAAENFDVSVDLVLVNRVKTESTMRERVKQFIHEMSLWKLYTAYRLLIASDPWYEHSTSLDDLDWLSSASRQQVEPNPAEPFGNELPTQAVERLTETDVAIRFGFGVLRGEALTAPAHGVLSYHHGDLSAYRGRPAGFYEFLHGEETAGITVQRLTEELDNGMVAAATEVDIAGAHSWREVKSRLFAASPDLLPVAVENCIEESLSTPDSLGPLYRLPSNQQLLQYLVERIRCQL